MHVASKVTVGFQGSTKEPNPLTVDAVHRDPKDLNPKGLHLSACPF